MNRTGGSFTEKGSTGLYYHEEYDCSFEKMKLIGYCPLCKKFVFEYYFWTPELGSHKIACGCGKLSREQWEKRSKYFKMSEKYGFNKELLVNVLEDVNAF